MLFGWEHFVEGYDFETLREYIRLFPNSPLTKMIRGYIAYMDLPSLDPDPDDKDEDEAEGLAAIEDQSAAFDLMLVGLFPFLLISLDLEPTLLASGLQEAFTGLQSSIFAHRMLSELYLWDMDYPNAISVAEVGLELVRRRHQDVGKELPL